LLDYFDPETDKKYSTKMSIENLPFYVIFDENLLPNGEKYYNNHKTMYDYIQEVNKDKGFSKYKFYVMGDNAFDAVVKGFQRAFQSALFYETNTDGILDQVDNIVSQDVEFHFSTWGNLISRNRDVEYIYNFFIKKLNYSISRTAELVDSIRKNIDMRIMKLNAKIGIDTPYAKNLRQYISESANLPSSYSTNNPLELWAESIQRFDTLNPQLKKEILAIINRTYPDFYKKPEVQMASSDQESFKNIISLWKSWKEA